MAEDTESKNVLAPPLSEDPRENMIGTAVTFLTNPKVRQNSLWQKKTFLQKKGLTAEEIEIAVRRAGIGDDDGRYQGNQSSSQAVVPMSSSVQMSSKWTRAKDAVSTVVIIAGLSYGVYHFYQDSIRPWLFGKRTVDTRLEEIEKSVKDLQNKMVETLQKLHEKQTVETVSRNQEQYSVTEIKNEIQSLKGLLLSRKQFPSIPSASPVLPSWQLSSSKDPSAVDTSVSQTSIGMDGDITSVVNGQLENQDDLVSCIKCEPRENDTESNHMDNLCNGEMPEVSDTQVTEDLGNDKICDDKHYEVQASVHSSSDA